MEERLIIAGFGGQGILFSGKLWAELMMEQGHEVTFFPSYGAEVRGGTCNCHVIVADDEIASPAVESATALIVMNQPSLLRFAPRLEPDGLAIVNSSLADAAALGDHEYVFAVPATEMANDLGNTRVANVIVMGVYNGSRNLVPFADLEDHLAEDLRKRNKLDLLELNLTALRMGRDWLYSEKRT